VPASPEEEAEASVVMIATLPAPARA